MFNSEVLDVVIGLVFIYLLYSLFATIIQELIATYVLNLRSKVLELAIVRMLEDNSKLANCRIVNIYQFMLSKISEELNTFSGQFYNHALIKFLGEDNNSRKPSYFTGEVFSKVLIDLLRGKDVKPGDDIKDRIRISLEEGKISIKDINHGDDIKQKIISSLSSEQPTKVTKVKIGAETSSFLNSVWADAQGDVDKFKVMLEKWFDETMKRTTGWYKKYTQIILLIVGLVLAVAFNVNTIEIVHKLEKDPNLRAQLVTHAENFLKEHPYLDKEIEQAVAKNDTNENHALSKLKEQRDTLINRAGRLVNDDMEKVNKVMGIGIFAFDWGTGPFLWSKLGYLLEALLGWVITALAISLGAPFWFDLLNKLMKLRSSVTSDTDDDKKNKSSDANKTVIDRKG